MSNIKLYPHNQETYNKIQEMWQTTNRVACIQATGTGKSFLILKCLFDIPDKNKVVLAPTEYIFEQLAENVDEDISNTQFLTYSKLSYMTDDEITNLNPSLIVLDEFHRCGAEEWGKGVQTLLNLFPNAKILGTSATPIRYLDNERDMSDELFNGNVAVNLPLPEAIIKGILPMPKYISALYTFEDEVENLKNKVINSHNSDEEKDELFKQIDLMRNKLNRSKGIPKIFEKHLTQPNGKFIVFCKNKEHLHEMKLMVVNWFKKAKLSNRIKTYIVYTGYKNTDQEFEEFKSNNDADSLKLLFSIEMLNEGLHINDITGVILLRPTVSPIIYYQQIGRAIDAGNNNKPLIFDFVNNFDNLGATQFIDDLGRYREKEIRNRKRNKNENIDIEEFVIWDEIKEVKDLFSNIEFTLHLRGDWDGWYKKLEEFYINNGHIDVPQNKGVKHDLGAWLIKQRMAYRKKVLTQEQILKLEMLNITWEFIDKWYDMYDIYKRYWIEKISCDDLNILYQDLRKWENDQRHYRNKRILPEEKIIKLNEINFIWKIDENEKRWNKMFSLLCKYNIQYNNYLIPNDFIYDNEKLGQWVSNIKKFNNLNQLPKDKKERLNKINFYWGNNNDYKWMRNYQELVIYYENNNSYNIPKGYKGESGNNLYTWLFKQKRLYNEKLLPQDKMELLKKIGVI